MYAEIELSCTSSHGYNRCMRDIHTAIHKCKLCSLRSRTLLIPENDSPTKFLINANIILE